MNTKQRFDFDPILEKISHHIPDEEINLLLPFKKFNTQGRSWEFKTSQLVRAHILFAEMKTNTKAKAKRVMKASCTQLYYDL